MKALSMTIALALTLMATTSQAEFCMKRFMAQQTRDEVKTNFRKSEIKALNASYDYSSQSGLVKKKQ